MSKREARGVKSGIGIPTRMEGKNGDLTIRKTKDGKILFVKEHNAWHPINTGIDISQLRKDVDRLKRSTSIYGISNNSVGGGSGVFPQFQGININSKNLGPGTFDPKIKFSVGGTDKFVLGVDDSDSDKFKLDTAGTIGGATKLTMDSSGNVDLAASNLKLGTGAPGVLLKNNAGVLQVRNVGESADAIIKAKRLQVDAGTSGTGGAVTGEIQYDSGDGVLFAHGTGLFVSNFITGSSGHVAMVGAQSHNADAVFRCLDGGSSKWIFGYDQSDSAGTGDKFKINTGATLVDASLFTLDTKGSVTMDVGTSGDSAEDKTGLHVDFDRTVAGSGTAAHNDIGVDLDVNSASLGTSSVKGMDIDVVGATSGTHTAMGIELNVSGADANEGLVITNADGGKDIVLKSSADTADYFYIGTTGSGATTIATIDSDAAVAHLFIQADGHVEFKGCGVGFDLGTATYHAVNGTCDFRLGNKQIYTFDGGSTTNIKIYFPQASGNFTLLLKQDVGGSRTITNYNAYESDGTAASGSDTVKFAGGSNPILTTDSNHVDILSFFWDSDTQIAYGVATLDFQF